MHYWTRQAGGRAHLAPRWEQSRRTEYRLCDGGTSVCLSSVRWDYLQPSSESSFQFLSLSQMELSESQRSGGRRSDSSSMCETAQPSYIQLRTPTQCFCLNSLRKMHWGSSVRYRPSGMLMHYINATLLGPSDPVLRSQVYASPLRCGKAWDEKKFFTN